MDNEEIQGIIPRLKKRYLTYGMSSQADLRGGDLDKKGLEVSFEVLYHDRSLGRIAVGIPGEHNVLNALAATAVGLELDLDMKVIKKGLKNLGGLARRFQVKGEQKDILVLDDYGHHPTEIITTLRTVKECWPERRLVVAFQPHRYTRTRALFERFVISFNDADILIVAPIFSAGEDAIEGVSAELLAREIKEHGHRDVMFCPREEDILSSLLAVVKPGDMLMTLGAGSIYRQGEKFLKKL